VKNSLMSGTTAEHNDFFFFFDEVRTDLQQISVYINAKINELKIKDDKGDSDATTMLFLHRGLYSIIEGEKKYRTGDYPGASTEFGEVEKLINRFQKASSNFSLDYQQEAERLELFAKGRYSECLALQEGTKLEDAIIQLIEAINSYSLETEIATNSKRQLLVYNAKARSNFVQGLVNRYEGEVATTNEDFRLAKRKHLDAYRAFLHASYFNPAYSIWITDQNNTINVTLLKLIKDKANKEWGLAFNFSNEGKFENSSEKCKIASKLFKRASKISADPLEAAIMLGYSFMLQASMYEAHANEFIKNKNDAKSAIRQYELASEALSKAISAYPTREGDQTIVKRWEAQQQFYSGHFYQTQGVYNLDQENYQEAIMLFNKANEIFEAALVIAEEINEKSLIKFIQKSLAEAKGYIGMCKTVLD
jgi:cellobiose-specific phosphotransferase system component IIA